jgi:DNA helicase-2/ATP-dependent DNA helicase PcrA
MAGADTLNDQQRLAVSHGLDVPGPVLVIAGAGSGKTNTLAHRVSNLVVHGVDPARILLLTFSRRAASEMTRRAQKIVNADRARGETRLPWSGTFHSVGARLLREYAPSIGINGQFTILDREDAADLLNMVRYETDRPDAEKRFPQKATCLSIYSRTVNSEAPLESVLEKHFPWCAGWHDELQQVFSAYVEAKQKQSVLDYDDLLLYWARMMAVPEIASDVGSRFDHVLVDEYQDTNRLQASVLMGLKPNGNGLMVVGDDAQAIYSFRAATVRNILDFPDLFYPPARIVTLERNYRSTQPLLDASNAVIGQASQGFSKRLWTEKIDGERPHLVTARDDADQARYVADKVLEARDQGISLKAQAVLFRASNHSNGLELELARRDIPFVKFGGLKFLDTAHVKDIMAILRLAENPRDRLAAFRTLMLMPGIGPKRAGAMADLMAAAPVPIDQLASHAPPKTAAGAWSSFLDLMRSLNTALAKWPGDIAQIRGWYTPRLEELYEDAHTRALDLDHLEQIAQGFSSRERFLTDLALDPPDATSDEAGVPSRDDDYLILSTIHSAKGLEWSQVFVLNVVDGCIPSDLGTGTTDEIDEERRLLYVAMTRAKSQLHLVVPQLFYMTRQAAAGDRHVYANRSRFIPNELLKHFEQRVATGPLDTEASALARLSRSIDLGSEMRKMWRSQG